MTTIEKLRLIVRDSQDVYELFEKNNGFIISNAVKEQLVLQLQYIEEIEIENEKDQNEKEKSVEKISRFLENCEKQVNFYTKF